MESVRRHLKLIGGLITGAISVLGAIRTMVEVGSGQQFGPQQLAFYLGASACAVYVAAIAGLMVGGLVSGVTGDNDTLLLAVAGVTSVLVLILLVNAGVLWDYEGTDAIGRGFLALVGLAGLAAGVWLFRRGDTTRSVANAPA